MTDLQSGQTVESGAIAELLPAVCFAVSMCVRPGLLAAEGETGSMYERHRRRYSFCAKGEPTVDVLLIKVGKKLVI